MVQDSPPRIVVHVHAISGGAGKNAVLYANILARHGYAVTLTCGRAPALAQFRPEDAVTLEIFGTRRNIAAVPHLRRVLARVAPDICLVVDAANLPAMLLALPACARRPQLILREALSTKERMALRGPLMRPLKALIYRAGYRRCDKVIALTQAMAGELREFWHLPPARVVHIPNGIALAPAKGIARVPGRIVCVARLEEQKDIATLLRAMALLRARRIDGHLVLAGTGRLEADLRAEVRRLKLDGAVEFLGHVDATGPLYASAALCVLPSRWEGFPNVVIEALAQGTPVVATATPGAVEILQDRDAGLLCRIGDAEDMASKIAQALSRDWDSAALHRRANDFSDDKLNTHVVGLFQLLLTRQSESA